MYMPIHHLVWLNNHPDRHLNWFLEMIKNGFDVHHLDGDSQNNHPANLVLIEHADHMRMHGIKANRIHRPIKTKGQQYRVSRRVFSECGKYFIDLAKNERSKNVISLALSGHPTLSKRLQEVA